MAIEPASGMPMPGSSIRFHRKSTSCRLLGMTSSTACMAFSDCLSISYSARSFAEMSTNMACHVIGALAAWHGKFFAKLSRQGKA